MILQKWFFYGIAANPPFVTFIFKNIVNVFQHQDSSQILLFYHQFWL